ncbi:DUF6493 family protein [Streptomyces sp. NPDC021224]|uniref:DUF6493 family protein n=1 Tax=unclassified Streptomyces TaxID=2593676 RepID=UPI00379BB105
MTTVDGTGATTAMTVTTGTTRTTATAAPAGAAKGPAAEGPAVEWDELRALIAGQVPQRVVARLAPFPVSRLRHLQPHVKALRVRLRRDMSETGRYVEAYDQVAATYVAGILCSATPHQAFGWLTQRGLFTTSWPLPGGGARSVDARDILDLLLLDHRDPAWQRDLALRLAAWLPTDQGLAPWLVTYGLAVRSGTRLPATDGFIRGWVSEGSLIRYGRHHQTWERPAVQFRPEPEPQPEPHPRTLLAWLRAEPRLREFLPRLFEVEGVGAEFADRYAVHFGADNDWPTALAALAAEGVLDRDELLDLCLAKLLRGDRPGTLRGFTALHDRIAPTPHETAARAGMYVRLAADGAGTVARTAQKLLKDLDAAGRLEPADFAELCAAVLTRPETALATTQLGWMDRAVRRDPARAPELVATAALAFGHPAASVQERALGLAARRLALAGPEVREQLREAAGSLDAALRGDAARLLGEQRAAEAEPPRLPGVPDRRLPPAVASPAELAERYAALLAARRVEPMELERVLEGAVALHHADAAAVAAAFAPLAARRPARTGVTGWSATVVSVALACLMDVLAGRPARAAHEAHRYLIRERFTSVNQVPVRRIHEIAGRLPSRRAPFLLATPTAADGSIDPEVLAGRLDRYRADSVRPWPDDLEQSLLRIPAAARADLTARVRALAGRKRARVVLPVLTGFHTQPLGSPEIPQGWGQEVSVPRVAPLMTAAVPPRAGTLAFVLAQTPDPLRPDSYLWPRTDPGTDDLVGAWPGIVPHHPELIAAHALPRLLRQAGTGAPNEADRVLPLLAEASGAPGPVVHLALGYVLTAAGGESRTAAVDALLTLAARGRLDAPALGAALAALWQEGIARPNRFVAALGDAARAGACAQVWDVVRALTAAVAADPGRRGLPDLLALGAECAATARIRADVPEIDALAALARPARVAKEAKRLREILRG